MRGRARLIPIFIILIILVLMVVEFHTHFLRRTFDDAVYNNYHHYLQCEALPTLTEIEEVLVEHKTTVETITNLAQGSILLQIDTTTCPGKGSVIIYYPSKSVREQIEGILGENTFFGIPITLINQ